MPIPRISFVSAESLRIPHLPPDQLSKLQGYQERLTSLAIPPPFYSLATFQTSVKEEQGRGSCAAFAFIGAVEARYKHDYGLDLDLSEEYQIHIVASIQHSNNPQLWHENISSWCGVGAAIDVIQDDIYLNLPMPPEDTCPYFGDANVALNAYGTLHGDADLQAIVDQSGITCDFQDQQKNWQPALTQQAEDSYEYDTRHIPLDARKNCRYAVTDLQVVDMQTGRDTNFLVQTIADDHEVQLGFSLWRLDFGDGSQYANGDPVAYHPVDGNLIARWQVPGVNEGTDDQGNPDPTNPGAKGVPGHSMILCGYDQTRQLFLFKNSWGSNSPFVWVPFGFISYQSEGGRIINSVRDPSLPPDEESMWLGKWQVDMDGLQGTLVLRRTRRPPFNDSTDCSEDRLGTFYDDQGVPHMVTGGLYADQKYPRKMSLTIELDHPESPPYPSGWDAQPRGQFFDLELFGPDSGQNGDYAAGFTTINNITYGVVLRRQPENWAPSTTSFSLDKWYGAYHVYSSDHATPDLLEVTVIGPAKNGIYPVRGRLNGVPQMFRINENNPHGLSWSPSDFLLYHTHEDGLASGPGKFAKRFADAIEYIGHRKTHNLHVPWCIWISMVAEENKAYFETVEEALQQGYEGCWYCLRQYDTD